MRRSNSAPLWKSTMLLIGWGQTVYGSNFDVPIGKWMNELTLEIAPEIVYCWTVGTTGCDDGIRRPNPVGKTSCTSKDGVTIGVIDGYEHCIYRHHILLNTFFAPFKYSKYLVPQMSITDNKHRQLYRLLLKLLSVTVSTTSRLRTGANNSSSTY